MRQFHKAKSVEKLVLARGAKLEKAILETMKTASDIVGATLGPSGMPALLERQENNLEPLITKDGVTVFRHLGFPGAVEQVVMEAARSAAVRTGAEAGDGTTTATVLAEAFVRLANDFIKKNPKFSPQKVVRILERTFATVIEPDIIATAAKPSRDMLFSVAKTSANGDEALAKAVMDCYDLVGDEGNVTIMEVSGPSSYQVEPIKGFPIAMGYEESCRTFYAKFINDPANQRCVLDKPAFLVYHGKITEIQQLVFLLENVGQLWQDKGFRHNVVVVATGFSESVITNLAANFAHPSMINVFPLLAPPSPLQNGQLDFLEDVAAVTGAELLDAVNKPLDRATIDSLGFGDALTSFEAGRFRSTIVGHVDEDEVKAQADRVVARIRSGGSELDLTLQRERLAKITGGVAKLIVIGSSGGEMKEKRDRAEDAVCAVRGAIKFGCLPGGGWTLLRLCKKLDTLCDPVISQVMVPALGSPVTRLLVNCGFLDPVERTQLMLPVLETVDGTAADAVVYDAYEGVHVKAFQAGVLDSRPAVLEAIRNSLSIASLLGTLGGCVVYGRDRELERAEAREASSFEEDSHYNPADERA